MSTDIIKLPSYQVRHLARERDKDRALALVTEGLNFTKSILLNPVFALVGAFVLNEYLQAHPQDRPLMPAFAGTALETILGSSALMQALGQSGALDLVSGLIGKASPAKLLS